MEYRQHQLDNGLRIVAECNPQGYSTGIGIFVKAGARDESLEIGGVSHFLEHMVFKGTPNRSAEDVNRQLDEMGSHSNARTGVESTIYHATVLPEFQTPVLELLCDIMRPSLRDEDFETEKKVIIEEIMMYDDQPPYGGYERIMADYFGEHPLGQSVLGTVDSVGGMTPENMRRYFETRYSPSNICIAAAGNVDFDGLVNDAEKFCGGWQNFEAMRKKSIARPRFGFEHLHKPQSTQQYLMQISPGPASEDEDRYAARVLSTILGDEGGSRMYWQFIDSGKAEMAGMGVEEYASAGLQVSFLCCAPDEAQSNIAALAELQNSVATDGVEKRELELAKQKISAQIILASERSENRMFAVGSSWLRDQSYKTVREVAACYEKVTLDDVNSILAKYPLTSNMTLSIGPSDDLQPSAG